MKFTARPCVLALLVITMAALPLSALSTDTAPAPLSADDFIFTFGDNIVRLHSPAQPFVKMVEASMGALDMIECEACLFSGMDREYSNDEIVFATYPNGPAGSDMIESILIIGGGWKTARGIGIGASTDEVAAVYGDKYILDYNEMRYMTDEIGEAPMIVFTFDLDTKAVTSFFLMNNTKGL